MKTNSLEQQNNIEMVRLRYRERCVRYGKRTRIHHELEPKSKRPNDWWE